MRWIAFTLLTFLFAGSTYAAEPSLIEVKTDFAGGSARVEAIDQNSRTIRLLPAAHKDRGWEAWWYSKIVGLKVGETLTLDVGRAPWATPDRASFSLDNKTWHHTEPGKRDKDRIVYTLRVESDTVWVAWGPPFTLDHARALVDHCVKSCPEAKAFDFAKSKEGRTVPGVRIDAASGQTKQPLGIWIQARQHAWESGSSWVCRGFAEWLVSDEERAVALRKRAVVTIIPVMDADNVERGAGGKNQTPHDHNRDWSKDAVWPEVQSAMSQIADLNRVGRFDLFVDLHNPAANDRQPFFMVSPAELLSARGRQNLDAFLEATRTEMRGPLPVALKPRESGKNYDPNWEKISKNWVTQNTSGHVVSVTLETSWNTPKSTTDGYRQVGVELGRGIERYLRESPR